MSLPTLAWLSSANSTRFKICWPSMIVVSFGAIVFFWTSQHWLPGDTAGSSWKRSTQQYHGRGWQQPDPGSTAWSSNDAGWKKSDWQQSSWKQHPWQRDSSCPWQHTEAQAETRQPPYSAFKRGKEKEEEEKQEEQREGWSEEQEEQQEKVITGDRRKASGKIRRREGSGKGVRYGPHPF